MSNFTEQHLEGKWALDSTWTHFCFLLERTQRKADVGRRRRRRRRGGEVRQKMVGGRGRDEVCRRSMDVGASIRHWHSLDGAIGTVTAAAAAALSSARNCSYSHLLFFFSHNNMLAAKHVGDNYLFPSFHMWWNIITRGDAKFLLHQQGRIIQKLSKTAHSTPRKRLLVFVLCSVDQVYVLIPFVDAIFELRGFSCSQAGILKA